MPAGVAFGGPESDSGENLTPQDLLREPGTLSPEELYIASQGPRLSLDDLVATSGRAGIFDIGFALFRWFESRSSPKKWS